MKIKFTLFVLILFFSKFLFAQAYTSSKWEEIKDGDNVTLEVMYYENKPFVYKEKGELKGIEVDILNYFVNWVKESKNIKIDLVYKEPLSFNMLLKQVENSKSNTIGLGSVTINEKRKARVSFSAPYLRNVSVLVTNGNFPTINSKEELKLLVDGNYAITVEGSHHIEYINSLHKEFGISRNLIQFSSDQNTVLKTVSESNRHYAYVDVIDFWKFLLKSDKYIKIHKSMSKKDELFGFIFPKSSAWINPFNEFMESGFGFTATKDYHKILERYLGYEIIETVEID